MATFIAEYRVFDGVEFEPPSMTLTIEALDIETARLLARKEVILAFTSPDSTALISVKEYNNG